MPHAAHFFAGCWLLLLLCVCAAAAARRVTHIDRHLHTHLCISASGRGGHGSESIDKFSRLTIRFAILHTAVRPSVSSVLHVTQAHMVHGAPCGARHGASARCLCVRVSSSTRSATTPQLDLLPGVLVLVSYVSPPANSRCLCLLFFILFSRRPDGAFRAGALSPGVTYHTLLHCYLALSAVNPRETPTN